MPLYKQALTQAPVSKPYGEMVKSWLKVCYWHECGHVKDPNSLGPWEW